MVFIRPFVTLALSALVLGAPANRRDDSAAGVEVAVSAPDGGEPQTNTAELSSQLSREAMEKTMMASATVTSSMMKETMMASSSSMMAEPTSYMMASSSSSAMYASATYGSGSTNWGSNSYNDCVNQCMAQYGTATSYTSTPTATMGAAGTGATVTVIVAPVQGVLRYVPAMVNATVGTTIRFEWHANNHTVTKGSALEVCNKTSNALFTSGPQMKDFVFNQIVNDTKPVWFFCNTPGHCQQGMFGVINMPSSAGANTSAGAMMKDMAAKSESLAAMASITKSMENDKNGKAMVWGQNADLAGMQDQFMPMMLENIQYTRQVMAANPELITENGGIDLGRKTAPLMWPADAGAAVRAPAQAASSSPAASESASSAASSSASTTASASSSASSAAQSSNGAGMTSPSTLVTLAAVLFAFLAL